MKCPSCGADLDPKPIAHVYYLCPRCGTFWILMGRVLGRAPAGAVEVAKAYAEELLVP